MEHSSPARNHFVFVSRADAWGGSEELWSAAATVLAEQGHAVTVYKNNVGDDLPPLRRLRELRCTMRDLLRFPFMPRVFFKNLARFSPWFKHAHQMLRLYLGLRLSRKPDLVIVSQGVNFDGCGVAAVCRKVGVPYALIAQKAADEYWPHDRYRKALRAIYADARAAFFVSEHNRELTEEQLGMELRHGIVVRNPFLVPWQRRDDWPSDERGLRLACIARMYPSEKGQDLLLRVLARDRWRARPITVTFYGRGDQSNGLEQLARYLRLTNVHFAGFIDDVKRVWDDHHALVLPSRCEGLPLVLVEAMLSGRVPIVTNAGGSGEVVDDGVTGFLAGAATEDALDETLERAWRRRDEWRAIGSRAADHIRDLVPPAPDQVMAAMLVELAGTDALAARSTDDGVVQQHVA